MAKNQEEADWIFTFCGFWIIQESLPLFDRA